MNMPAYIDKSSGLDLHCIFRINIQNPNSENLLQLKEIW